MLGHVGVGPGQQQAVVGDLRRGGPDLLAVDDEVRAIALGPGGQAGQVRSGARLAEPLAPGVLAGRMMFWLSVVPPMAGLTNVASLP